MKPPAERPTEDPWLYFYEYFLSEYDPRLRKDSGVYYTPVEIVKCQVALVDELLRGDLKRPGGFTHKDVITLDPAAGTGTYLLGVVDHALSASPARRARAMSPPARHRLRLTCMGSRSWSALCCLRVAADSARYRIVGDFTA